MLGAPTADTPRFAFRLRELLGRSNEKIDEDCTNNKPESSRNQGRASLTERTHQSIPVVLSPATSSRWKQSIARDGQCTAMQNESRTDQETNNFDESAHAVERSTKPDTPYESPQSPPIDSCKNTAQTPQHPSSPSADPAADACGSIRPDTGNCRCPLRTACPAAAGS